MITANDIRETAGILARDPVYITGLKAAMLDSGLAGLLGLTIDESKLDPYRPMPQDWTAMQIAFFDNGERGEVRKRPKIQRTKMRWGANIKVWTRDDISFSNQRHVAWTANFHLWTRDEARAIVADLHDEGYVDVDAVELVEGVCESWSDIDIRVSIPLLKVGLATQWMRGHLVVTMMSATGEPVSAIVMAPDCPPVVTGEAFSDVAANGEALGGKAVLQARLARHQKFSPWATEIME